MLVNLSKRDFLLQVTFIQSIALIQPPSLGNANHLRKINGTNPMTNRLPSKLVILASLLWPLIAGATPTTEKEALAASFFTPDINTARLNAYLGSQPYQLMAKEMGRIANQRILPRKNPNANAPNLLVFATLGMPRPALKALLSQADKYRIPIVIRGVLPGGFTQTINQVQSLVIAPNKKKAIGGIAINPRWFKQFHIQQAPAFVAIKPGACQSPAPCPEQDFDVLYGNMSLTSALDYLAQHGLHSQAARRALQ